MAEKRRKRGRRGKRRSSALGSRVRAALRVEREGDRMGYTVRGDVDARAVEQLVRCADEGNAVAAATGADGHVGYSQPIGGVVAYRDQISPSGVGYDIGCGNKAVKTSLPRTRSTYRESWMRSWHGSASGWAATTMSLSIIRYSRPSLTQILSRSASSPRSPRTRLGTVGAGNHYVDLFADQERMLWIGVHFGSRGFGHKTASDSCARTGQAV